MDTLNTKNCKTKSRRI